MGVSFVKFMTNSYSDTEHDGSDGNVSDLYSVDVQFESRPEHRLRDFWFPSVP
jgi:hypothetical protein